MLKHLLVAAAISTAGMSVAQAADPSFVSDGKVAVCTTANFPPLTFKKDAGDALPIGIDIDIATALAKTWNATTFILDHPGVPHIVGGAIDIWAVDIAELPGRPTINVKLSGISAYTGGNWTLATLQPYVSHVLEHFDAARAVRGSDSPVCTLQSNLAEWVAASHALLAGCIADDRNVIFRENALRIWKIAQDSIVSLPCGARTAHELTALPCRAISKKACTSLELRLS